MTNKNRYTLFIQHVNPDGSVRPYEFFESDEDDTAEDFVQAAEERADWEPECTITVCDRHTDTMLYSRDGKTQLGGRCNWNLSGVGF